MNVLVLDLAVLSYRRESDCLEVLAPGVGTLVRKEIPPGTSDRESVFLALDEVLASARVAYGQGWASVGLYNPFSGEVAIGSLPSTEAVVCPEPVELPLEGLFGEFSDGVLDLAGQACLPRDDSWSAVAAALAAHR